MKDKIKDFLLVVVYFVGMLILFSFFESKEFKDSSIGQVLSTIGAIIGFLIVGYISYVFIVGIYVTIRDYFKRKVQEEARKVVAREKYLEKLRNKEKQHEED